LFKNFREFSSLLTLVFVAGMVFFAGEESLVDPSVISS
jgi:hypothetical protein